MPDHPHWQAHIAPQYDAIMQQECDRALTRIGSDRDFRLQILSDPRDLHRDLFARFVPPEHSEYAGNYRGTVRTSLEGRSISAPCLFVPKRFFTFAAPAEVANRMGRLTGDVAREMGRAAELPPQHQLMLLAHLFCWFGTIHPFLDGNGHIQRLLFAAAATDMRIPLSRRFAVHPRSFDRLLAFPLEMFTRAGGSDEYLAMTAEYLAFWLAGPFDLPGAGISDIDTISDEIDDAFAHPD